MKIYVVVRKQVKELSVEKVVKILTEAGGPWYIKKGFAAAAAANKKGFEVREVTLSVE